MNQHQAPMNSMTLKICWGALTFSMIIYGFILFTTKESPFIGIPETYSMLETVALISNIILFGTFFIHSHIIQPLKSPEKRFSFYVMCWALHESMAVLAFAAVFVSGTNNMFVYVVNLIMAIFGNLMTFPKEPELRGKFGSKDGL